MRVVGIVKAGINVTYVLHQSTWPDFSPSALDPGPEAHPWWTFGPSEDVDEVWLFPAGKKEGVEVDDQNKMQVRCLEILSLE